MYKLICAFNICLIVFYFYNVFLILDIEFFRKYSNDFCVFCCYCVIASLMASIITSLMWRIIIYFSYHFVYVTLFLTQTSVLYISNLFIWQIPRSEMRKRGWKHYMQTHSSDPPC